MTNVSNNVLRLNVFTLNLKTDFQDVALTICLHHQILLNNIHN